MDWKHLAIVVVWVLAATLIEPYGAAVAAAEPGTATAVAINPKPMTTRRFEARVLHWINRARARNGRAPLAHDSCANRLAESWARRLRRTGSLRHQPMARVLRRCRVAYAGEIVLGGSVTPGRAVRAWLESPDHRKVLMRGSTSRAGVGAVRTAIGDWVVTVDLTGR